MERLFFKGLVSVWVELEPKPERGERKIQSEEEAFPDSN